MKRTGHPKPRKDVDKGATGPEEALPPGEGSYHQLFNTILMAISIHDPEGRFLEVNDGKCAMYGYAREEFIGRTPEFLTAPGLNDFSFIAEKIRQALAGEPQQIEFWGKRRNGEIFPSDVRLYPGTSFDREVVIFVATDITEQKKTETARRESEERYRHLLEAVTDYVFTVRVENGHAVETVHGPGCEAVTGYPTRDFSRDPGLWLRMVVEEDRPLVIGQAERILAGEHVHAIEHRIVDKSGQVRWVMNTLVPRYDASGSLAAYDGLIQDVTPRKVVELAFSKSEAQLGAIIRASPIPMFVIDNRHRVVAWNTALEKTSGIRSHEILGTSRHWKAFYPDKRSCLADLIVDNALQMIPDLYPDKVRKSDIIDSAYEATDFFPQLGDGGKWLHFIAAPITDSENKVIGSVETLEDITVLVRAEQELKESEERYSSLFSHNYSVSLIIDPDTGTIVEVNEAAARYYGYSREQLLTMGIYDLNRLPRVKVVRNLTRAKDENEKHFFSTHYLADGEKREVEIYSGPIRIRGKTHFYSIIHDITENRKAVQALQESEERYRTLIDQLPDYVIVHRDGVLLYVNRTAAASTGHDANTLVGRPITEFIAPEHLEKVRAAVIRRMAGEDIPSYEMGIVVKDGTFHTVLVHGAAIRYEGQPASLNVLTDITLIKQAEEKIRQANDELEKRVTERTEALSRANEQLTAEIAARKTIELEIGRSLGEKDLLLREIHHRVKNNLQIIASLLNLQSRNISDPHVLEAIRSSQSRIRAMALVHERIYRSHKIAEINLREYLTYLTKQIFQFYNIQQHLITLSVTMDDIVTDIDTVTPLGLIINELVSNSLKHAFPDGRKGSISIKCTREDTGSLRFIYHDDGAGMPPGFEWKTAESLGLRMVNSLVDQLNGTITLGNGEGTTFTIEIRENPPVEK
jgi:PAS domain S-box-containing protein